MEKKGNKYGTHRVISPSGVLPQAAEKIDNNMDIRYSNEIVCNVTALNIDSASFTQLYHECGGDLQKIEQKILEIVDSRGKMQNPVTGSGGMFIGSIAHIGRDIKRANIKVGDKIASLVSLSLTPLKINKILKIYPEIDRVEVDATAILFESGIYAVLPDDIPENLALAALDVAGAPAQASKLVKQDDSVLVLGAAGKSGMLVCYEAKKQAGKNGKVVGVVLNQNDADRLLELGIVDKVIIESATYPIAVLEKVLEANDSKEYDIAFNCVNVENTEMTTILPVKDGGTVYFFSMATSFTKAALGAEGVGKDINMLVGNGYTKGNDQITLSVLRESPKLRKVFEELYL